MYAEDIECHAFKDVSKHGNSDEGFAFDTGMLSRPGPTFRAVSPTCGGGGGSTQPSKPHQGAQALFPTPQGLHGSYGKLQLLRSNY